MRLLLLLFMLLSVNSAFLAQLYTEVAKEVSPFRRQGGSYSTGLDIKGDIAVAGDSYAVLDANGNNPLQNAGLVHVYERQIDGSWTMAQSLEATDRITTGYFGTSVGVSGNQVLVGSLNDEKDSLGNNTLIKCGAVYVFEKISGTWTQVQKIVPYDRVGGEQYGFSLDLFNDQLVVGARGDNLVVDPTIRNGNVYYYERDNNGRWNIVKKFNTPVTNVSFGDDLEFGFDVAVENNIIAIGDQARRYDMTVSASVSDTVGAVYVYKRNSGVWSLSDTIFSPNVLNPNAKGLFGGAIDIGNGKLVVGDPFDDGEKGLVHVYDVSTPSNTYLQIINRYGPVSIARGWFGFSIDCDKDRVIIGAPTYLDLISFYIGSTALYSFGGTVYNQVQIVQQQNPSGQISVFGVKVAIDSNNIFVSAPADKTNENDLPPVLDTAGAFYIFEQCIQANIPQISGTASICQGDSVQLVINSANNLYSAKEWYWYTGAYATGTLIDSTDTIWVSPTSTTTYSIAGEGYCVAPNSSDSVGTFTVTVNPSPTITANSSPSASVCNGESVTLTGGGGTTYVWDNSVIDGTSFVPALGTITYKVIGADANGCVDSATVDVTVSNAITVGINYTGSAIICSGTAITLTGTGAATYSWSPSIPNGTSFTPLVTNTYTLTGTSASGCSATADTTITVIAGPSVTANAGVTSICEGESLSISATGADTYVWDNLGAGQTQNISPLITTMYYVTGTQNSTMCTDIDSIEITVNALPVVVAVASPNDSLCLGESLTLTSGAISPVWNNGVVENITFTPNLGSVDYIVTSTSANNCTNKDTINVKVFSLPVISGAVSSPGAICSGNLVTLNGFGGVSYVWDSAGFDIGIINGVPFSPSPGSNVFNLTGADANGCIGTAIQSLTVNGSPLVAAVSSAGGSSLCEGDTVSLTATGTGQSYTWNNGVIDGGYFIPPVGTNLYTVTATSINQCTSTASVSILVNAQEDATITPILPLCGGVPIETLSAVTPGGIWQGLGIVNSSTGEFDASVSGEGIFQIIYTTAGVCNDSDTISIEVYPELIVNAYGDSVCFGDQDGEISVEVIQGVAPYVYLWYDNQTISTIAELGEGVYSIEVKDANNCIVNMDVDVILTEICDYHLFLPNVFSPNGDGSNDVFYARGKGFESLSLLIYDRWGNKIFETTDKYKGWDGMKNGKPVVAGVYVYYVEVTYYDGSKEVVEGNVCVAY